MDDNDGEQHVLDAEFFDAVLLCSNGNDPARLAAILNSDYPLGTGERRELANLILNAKWSAGRGRPSKKFGEKEARRSALVDAKDEARRLRSEGATRVGSDEVIDSVPDLAADIAARNPAMGGISASTIRREMQRKRPFSR